ncbi:hypothetical protein MBLNU457_5235t2 [Dothideomycetes sp. NU457]
MSTSAALKAKTHAHNKTAVLGVYRLLLRKIGKTFKEDEQTLVQAKLYARDGFNKYRHERYAGTIEAVQGIEHAKGVAQILEENVVQGSKLKGDANAPYKLNIHERTERGDNESVKQFRGSQKSFKSMKA